MGWTGRAGRVATLLGWLWAVGWPGVAAARAAPSPSPLAQAVAQGLLPASALRNPAAPAWRGWVAQALAQVLRQVGLGQGAKLRAWPFRDVSPRTSLGKALWSLEALGLGTGWASPPLFRPSVPLRQKDLAYAAVDLLSGGQDPALTAPQSASQVWDQARALGLVGAPAPRDIVTVAQLAQALENLAHTLRLGPPVAAALGGPGMVAAFSPAPVALTLSWPGGHPLPAALASLYAAHLSLSPSLPPGLWQATALPTSPGWQVMVSRPGSYQLRATVAGGWLSRPLHTAPLGWTVYGSARQVRIQAPASLPADGQATATATLEVVDAQGHIVPSAQGVLTVSSTDPEAVAIEAPSGAPAQYPLTVPLKDGVAHVTLVAGTLAGFVAGIQAVYAPSVTGQADVAAAPQVPTRVVVEPARPALPDTRGAQDPLTAFVADQAGYPMRSGTYPLTLSLSGPPGAPSSSLPLLFSPGGAGPISVTYRGGQPAAAGAVLLATGQGGGTVVITAQSAGSALHLAPGTAQVSVVAPLPPLPSLGKEDSQGLVLAPLAGPTTSLAVGQTLPLAVAYVGTGTAPQDAPQTLTVTVQAQGPGGGEVALAAPGASAPAGSPLSLTLPQGTSQATFYVTGLAPGPVTLTAQASPPGGTSSPWQASLTLAVTAPSPSSWPVAAQVTGAQGSAAVEVPSPGAQVPVTLTLLGPGGAPQAAPAPMAVLLGDAGAQGQFLLNGTGVSLVAVPPGVSQLSLVYQGSQGGSVSLSASLVSPAAWTLAPKGPGPQRTEQLYQLTAPASQVPSPLASLLPSLLEVATWVPGTRPADVTVAPTESPGEWRVAVTWQGPAPSPQQVYVALKGVGPQGPLAVPLGWMAGWPSLSAPSPQVSLSADLGQTTVPFQLRGPAGQPLAGVEVTITLDNAVGSSLSLSAQGSVEETTLPTNAQGLVQVTVYGHAVPDQALLIATASPTGLPVQALCQVEVKTGAPSRIVLPPTEAGTVSIPADRGVTDLVFLVTDQSGNPVAGVPVAVSLALGSSGLSLHVSQVTTDAAGLAVVPVFGTRATAQGAVTASLPQVPGTPSVTTGPLQVEPGAPARLLSSLPPGDAFPAPAAHGGIGLRILVVDRWGNPVPGPLPLFAQAQGVLSLASSQAVTDASGEAGLTLVDPSGRAGSAQITVQGPAGSGLTLTVPFTVVSGPPAQVQASPLSAQEVTAGTMVSFQLTAQDAYGNPVQGTYSVTLEGSLVRPSPSGQPAPGTLQTVTFQDGMSQSPVSFAPVAAQASGEVTAVVGPLDIGVAVPGTLTVTPAAPAYVVLTGLSSQGPTRQVPLPPGPWPADQLQASVPVAPGFTYRGTLSLVDAFGNPTPVAGVLLSLAFLPAPVSHSTLTPSSVDTSAQGTATFTYRCLPSQESTAPDRLVVTLEATGEVTTVSFVPRGLS
jgi:hypothetical protein